MYVNNEVKFMKYTWEYNDDTELWYNDLFDTVEDCIADARDNYMVEIGETIAVGEVVPYEPYVMADNILDELEEDAYEECGEVAEDWNAYSWKDDKESLDELSNKLTEIVRQWLKDNGTYPYFYKIENVKTVEVK